MRPHLLIGLPLCVALLGCSGNAQTSPESGGADAIVLRGDDFTGNVLDALRSRVRSANVETPTGTCPRITFRGVRSVTARRDPSVYVDGTLMLNTCVLQQITSGDVDRVEIYPGGNSPRSNIQGNPSGLILIFRRQA